MSLEGITLNNKHFTLICNDKMKHMAYHCVTVNEFMDNFYENIELSDIICKKCSKFSGKINKEKFEKHQLVLNPPMQLRIFIPKSEYNGLIDRNIAKM